MFVLFGFPTDGQMFWQTCTSFGKRIFEMSKAYTRHGDEPVDCVVRRLFDSVFLLYILLSQWSSFRASGVSIIDFAILFLALRVMIVRRGSAEDSAAIVEMAVRPARPSKRKLKRAPDRLFEPARTEHGDQSESGATIQCKPLTCELQQIRVRISSNLSSTAEKLLMELLGRSLHDSIDLMHRERSRFVQRGDLSLLQCTLPQNVDLEGIPGSWSSEDVVNFLLKIDPQLDFAANASQVSVHRSARLTNGDLAPTTKATITNLVITSAVKFFIESGDVSGRFVPSVYIRRNFRTKYQVEIAVSEQLKRLIEALEHYGWIKREIESFLFEELGNSLQIPSVFKMAATLRINVTRFERTRKVLRRLPCSQGRILLLFNSAESVMDVAAGLQSSQLVAFQTPAVVHTSATEGGQSMVGCIDNVDGTLVDNVDSSVSGEFPCKKSCGVGAEGTCFAGNFPLDEVAAYDFSGVDGTIDGCEDGRGMITNAAVPGMMVESGGSRRDNMRENAIEIADVSETRTGSDDRVCGSAFSGGSEIFVMRADDDNDVDSMADGSGTPWGGGEDSGGDGAEVPDEVCRSRSARGVGWGVAGICDQDAYCRAAGADGSGIGSGTERAVGCARGGDGSFCCGHSASGDGCYTGGVRYRIEDASGSGSSDACVGCCAKGAFEVGDDVDGCFCGAEDAIDLGVVDVFSDAKGERVDDGSGGCCDAKGSGGDVDDGSDDASGVCYEGGGGVGGGDHGYCGAQYVNSDGDMGDDGCKVRGDVTCSGAEVLGDGDSGVGRVAECADCGGGGLTRVEGVSICGVLTIRGAIVTDGGCGVGCISEDCTSRQGDGGFFSARDAGDGDGEGSCQNVAGTCDGGGGGGGGGSCMGDCGAGCAGWDGRAGGGGCCGPRGGVVMGHTVYGCCCHLSACSARSLSGDSVSGVHCCRFRGAGCCSSDFVVFGGGVDGSGYCSAEGAGGICCCGLFGADDLFGDDDSGGRGVRGAEVASGEGSGCSSNGFDGCSCFGAEGASDCGFVGVQDLIGCGGRCHGDRVADGRCIGACCGEGGMMGYGGCVSGGSLCGTEGGCCGEGSIFVGGSGGGCDFVGCCGVSDGAMIGDRRGVSGGGRDVRGARDAGADGSSGSCCVFDDGGSNIGCDYIGCYGGKGACGDGGKGCGGTEGAGGCGDGCHLVLRVDRDSRGFVGGGGGGGCCCSEGAGGGFFDTKIVFGGGGGRCGGCGDEGTIGDGNSGDRLLAGAGVTGGGGGGGDGCGDYGVCDNGGCGGCLSRAEVAGGGYGCGGRDACAGGGLDGVEVAGGDCSRGYCAHEGGLSESGSGGACDFKGASGDGGGGRGGFQCGYGGVRGGGNDGCCCAGGAVRDGQVVMVVGSCGELGEGVRSNGCRGGACDSGGCYRVVGTGGGDDTVTSTCGETVSAEYDRGPCTTLWSRLSLRLQCLPVSILVKTPANSSQRAHPETMVSLDGPWVRVEEPAIV